MQRDPPDLLIEPLNNLAGRGCYCPVVHKSKARLTEAEEFTQGHGASECVPHSQQWEWPSSPSPSPGSTDRFMVSVLVLLRSQPHSAGSTSQSAMAHEVERATDCWVNTLPAQGPGSLRKPQHRSQDSSEGRECSVAAFLSREAV